MKRITNRSEKGKKGSFAENRSGEKAEFLDPVPVGFEFLNRHSSRTYRQLTLMRTGCLM
jgi:hypothetical protein